MQDGTTRQNGVTGNSKQRAFVLAMHSVVAPSYRRIMSSVRMCDRCGNMFSERSEGWETYTATMMVKKPYPHAITTVLDACPDCAIGFGTDNETTVTPRLNAPKEIVTNGKDNDRS